MKLYRGLKTKDFSLRTPQEEQEYKNKWRKILELRKEGYFAYRPTSEERGNRRKITPTVKRKMSEGLDVPIQNLKSRGYKGNSLYIKHEKEYDWGVN